MDKKFKFADKKIRALEPAEKRVEYYDELVTGMILRITKTGHKSFAYRYWFRGKSKQITIGKFDDIKLGEARAIARKYKNKVREGTDPLEEIQKKKEIPDEITFKELTELYEGIHLPTLRESSQEYHKWAISSKVLPYLGKRNLKEISDTDIIRVLDRIAIQDDAQATANKVRSRLHHLFEFAKSRSYVKTNPVSNTSTYKGGYNQSERYYSEDEIKSIWQAIEDLNEPVQSYMKIITLTGQRRTETHKMKWENIQHIKDSEFTGWAWVIPKHLAKSDRDHEIQLSPLAIEIIRDLKERAGTNPFVFASGASDDIPIGLKTIKRAAKTIKDESGVTDFRLHDMRRTVATYMAKLQTPAEVVSKVLNHKTGGSGSLVTRIYNRYEYRRERQVAFNKWSYELERIISEKEAANIKQMGG
ncbi:MAG: tyrosine-type recombinase/integrase [Balneolaceae bacterium]|nr:tyrosine-type recombinase/integrase [Balneolaceae bacterium]